MLSSSQSKRLIRTVQYIFLITFFWIMIFPLIIMVSTSLKDETEIYLQATFKIIPKAWKFSNFYIAMKTGNWLRYFFNSFFVTSISVVGSILLNSFAGWSFAVMRFPFKRFLFIFLIIGIIVPYQVVIIPQYLIMKSIPLFGGNNLFGQGGKGWLDSYWALIIPQLSGSFGIFLCRQYYLNIPNELNEAAKIDGCNRIQTFVKIYIPLSKPIFATLAILKSVYVWNDFFYPLIMTTRDDLRTVQLGLDSYRNFALVRWELMMAATTLICLPLIIMFFVFQRYFVQTAISSGLKG